MNEPKTVPRGVLWMVTGFLGLIIAVLVSLVADLSGSWVSRTEKLVLDNQNRISVLEGNMRVINVQLDLVRTSQEKMLTNQEKLTQMLQNHMQQR